jgi:hypothetical protein
MLATVSFAAWTPTPLEISVDEEVIYLFPGDGTTVDIPVTVENKNARAWLWINSKLDDEDKPLNLQNGPRGWHYVNGIDTTIYVSGAEDFVVGTGNKFTWDGYGNENTGTAYGGTYEANADAVDAGTYNYCVWAYDDENVRDPVCNYLCISWYWYSQYTRIGEWNDDGTARANPYIWGNIGNEGGNQHRTTDDDGNYVPREGWLSYGPPRFTVYKFPIGSDPDDMEALETTMLTGYTTGDTSVNPEIPPIMPSPVVFDPADEDTFYILADKMKQKTATMFKYTFNPGGDAEVVPDWGGWDDLEIPTQSNRGSNEYACGTSTDGNFIYIVSPGRDATVKWDKFYAINFDGSIEEETQLDPFYFADSKNKNSYVNRFFAALDIKNQACMGGEQSCLTMMVHADRIAAGDDDYIQWFNGNGDFYLDASWDPAVTDPTELWQCNQGAFKTPNMGRHDEVWFEGNGVVVKHPDFNGLTSIVVLTQDGSGVCYAQFADDTVSQVNEDGDKKGSGQRCDNGTIYDGIYTGFCLYQDAGIGWNNQQITWFGMDSDTGLITNVATAVEEAGQDAFSVDAAYPNPANPTTTIGFTLAEAGHVSVDIYNVAGQKVDTLVDGEMSIGSHSVVWDASQFAAGVYFYTVKSGNYSKTMKVTLLK